MTRSRVVTGIVGLAALLGLVAFAVIFGSSQRGGAEQAASSAATMTAGAPKRRLRTMCIDVSFRIKRSKRRIHHAEPFERDIVQAGDQRYLLRSTFVV